MTATNFLRPWCRRRRLAVLLLVCLCHLSAWLPWLFVDPYRGSPGRGHSKWRCTLRAELEDIRKMRAKEIKKELIDQGIDVSDIFDKEELVERLWQLRSGVLQPPPAPAPATEAVDAPPAEPAQAPQAVPEAETGSTGSTGSTSAAAGDFVAQCRQMKVVELRTELGQRGISWADALDKDELVERFGTCSGKRSSILQFWAAETWDRPPRSLGRSWEEELADSTTPLLLDVYATWCGPCKVMETHLEAAAKKLGNKIRVAKMDSDEEGDASTKLRVNGLPTLILFDRDGKQVQRNEGAMMESQIIEMVQAAKLWGCQSSAWADRNPQAPLVEHVMPPVEPAEKRLYFAAKAWWLGDFYFSVSFWKSEDIWSLRVLGVAGMSKNITPSWLSPRLDPWQCSCRATGALHPAAVFFGFATP